MDQLERMGESHTYHDVAPERALNRGRPDRKLTRCSENDRHLSPSASHEHIGYTASEQVASLALLIFLRWGGAGMRTLC